MAFRRLWCHNQSGIFCKLLRVFFMCIWSVGYGVKFFKETLQRRIEIHTWIFRDVKGHRNGWLLQAEELKAKLSINRISWDTITTVDKPSRWEMEKAAGYNSNKGHASSGSGTDHLQEESWQCQVLCVPWYEKRHVSYFHWTGIWDEVSGNWKAPSTHHTPHSFRVNDVRKKGY